MDGELSLMIAPAIFAHKPKGTRSKSIRTNPQAKTADRECLGYRQLGVSAFIGTWEADLALLEFKQNSSRTVRPIEEIELSAPPLVWPARPHRG